VDFSSIEFASCLRAQKPFEAGELITRFEGLSKGPKAYTSVQCGPGLDDNVELNSDLVFVNHSCEPNVAFDISSLDSSEWHVRALRDIGVGTALTFFYPSTEWAMCQPFDCRCAADSCLKRVQGAAYLSREELQKRGFANSHIWAMVNRRDALSSKTEDGVCLSCGYGLSPHDDQRTRCGCKTVIIL